MNTNLLEQVLQKRRKGVRKIKENVFQFPVVNGPVPFKSKISKSLMSVKNLTDKSADLYIYGEIVDNSEWKWDESDVMPNDVKDALEQVDGLETLNIYINSPGGSIFSGLAIYNMLKRNTSKKIVHIDGVAASMASVIALVGDEIYMPSNAFMMIHKPLTGLWGNADDLREVADSLDTIQGGLMNSYEENMREGVTIEEIEEMVNKETWLDAEEATKYFNIELTEPKQIVASAKHLLSEYKNVPKSLLKEAPKVAKVPQNKNEDETLKLQNELDLLNL